MSIKKIAVAAMLLLGATSATLAQGYATHARSRHGHSAIQYGGGSIAAPANPGAGIGSER